MCSMSFSWSLFVYRACDVSLNVGKTYPFKAILWCFHFISEIRFVLLFVLLTLLFHVAFYSFPFMPWIYTGWSSWLSDVQHINYWLLMFVARVTRKLKTLQLSTFRGIELLLHRSEINLAEMSSGDWLSSRFWSHRQFRSSFHTSLRSHSCSIDCWEPYLNVFWLCNENCNRWSVKMLLLLLLEKFSVVPLRFTCYFE